MSNEITKRINSVKGEIKKLEQELQELEKENVHFYAVIMQSDDISRDYFQIALTAISEAETKKLVLDNYWHFADNYSIGYVPVTEEIHQKIGDLVQLRLVKKTIDRCLRHINEFGSLDGLAVFEQQLDKTIENRNCEIDAMVNIEDVTFVDFED